MYIFLKKKDIKFIKSQAVPKKTRRDKHFPKEVKGNFIRELQRNPDSSYGGVDAKLRD